MSACMNGDGEKHGHSYTVLISRERSVSYGHTLRYILAFEHAERERERERRTLRIERVLALLVLRHLMQRVLLAL